MRTFHKTGCLLVMLCLLFAGNAAGEGAAEAGDSSWFHRLAQRVAAQQYTEILIHPESDAPVTEALAAVLADGRAICPDGQQGLYDFPMLECGVDALCCRATGIYGSEGVECWVITFYPEGLQTMAATAAVTAGGDVREVFCGSSWSMRVLWEEALGEPSFLWQPESVFRFSQLFEGEKLWMRAHRPGHKDISQQAALHTAQAALEAAFRIPEKQSSQWRAAACFHLSDRTPGQTLWSVHYYQQKGDDYTLLYSVVMDSRTGQVLECTRNEPGGLG